MFVHRLALALGKTVTELLRECTAAELSTWAAYFDVAPPEHTDDHRAALICATMAKLHGRRAKIDDFMPKRRVREQTPASQIALFRELTS